MRFQAGQWVEDDGTPIDPQTMMTASQGRGPATGDASEQDPRKVKPVKRDPRKNRKRQ